MFYVSFFVAALSAAAIFGVLSGLTVSATTYEPNEIAEPQATSTPSVEHIETPEPLKAIYMSQCAASDVNGLRKSVIAIADETEINAIVIDLKDYTGTVAFPSETAEKGGKGCTVANFRDFVKELHDRDIYVIGRLTVFQDPLYTKAHPEEAVKQADGETVWKDRKGLSFVDVASKPFWGYIVTLAKEAYVLGVDEVNFDYVRYPSDGDMQNIAFTHTRSDHADELERFFRHLAQLLGEDGPVRSADLFGMTTTNEDDLNIGQVLERALPYFDYIAPMVYPSHYPSGFHGYENVNEHAYDIVHYSMKTAAGRAMASTTTVGGFTQANIGTTSYSYRGKTIEISLYKKPVHDKLKLRPWLQDFDYPVEYTPAMVADQIRANEDAGLTSWMFWDPANRYSSLRQALKKE